MAKSKGKGRSRKGQSFRSPSNDQDFKKSKSNNGRKGETNQDVDKDKSYGGNDLSWYTHNAALIASAAKIPFALQPGREVSWEPIMHWHAGERRKFNKYQYPGIARLGFSPCVGRSGNISSPLNVCAREIYGRIRANYSGSLEADAPDIMMYILALDSMYMLYENLKRAYYVTNLHTPYNNLYPKALMRAMGFDYAEIYENRMKVYQYLNETGALLSKFMVPDIMDLFKRHSWMCANVYADSPSLKSQTYVFSPDSYYSLENLETGTTLSSEPIRYDAATGIIPLQDYMDMLTNDIQKLMLWDTSYTIIGYLQRAYAGTNFIIPTPVIFEGLLNPVYNYEVLTQIENATIVPVDIDTLSIYQSAANNNMLTSTPRVDMYPSSPLYLTGTVLNMHGDVQPSDGDLIIATRLATIVDVSDDVSLTVDKLPVDCGTEILRSLKIINNPEGDANFYVESTLTDLETSLRGAISLNCFNMHPTVIFYDNVDSQDETNLYYGQDVENLSFVVGDTLAELHRFAIYSEFGCFSGN